MCNTIAAIATPPGEGGIAVIRISGPESLKIANAVFSKNIYLFKSHTAHYGHIQNAQGELIDHVLVLPMLAPRSYTGEDVVEIHCHGGLMATKVLKTILDAGASPAGPGEFTYRAYINGKMDLAQAEAVQALIGAKNELALKAANAQLEGALSQKIENFQKQLADTAAILEAWVDFPEEGLEFASLEETIANLETIQTSMHALNASFHDGKIISQGLSLCLVGSPNVGKSSLMNLLLGKDRAIVTHLPGTTRDTLEDDLKIGGLHFRLIDTAGMRVTDELIEKEGIKRSQKALEQADLILFVLDTTRPLQ
ncbi:MAG: tRNA uridine-5-carboxymethylaminomethyl(34) synthesis GTPase MnmE, partial [Chlamydiia bacterium]|nr:tRNA uridine-5-carboxymethylaminomethyl(34) synthesis GTPase MnmE [Chlamydiia bacterium]